MRSSHPRDLEQPPAALLPPLPPQGHTPPLHMHYPQHINSTPGYSQPRELPTQVLCYPQFCYGDAAHRYPIAVTYGMTYGLMELVFGLMNYFFIFFGKNRKYFFYIMSR